MAACGSSLIRGWLTRADRSRTGDAFARAVAVALCVTLAPHVGSAAERQSTAAQAQTGGPSSRDGQEPVAQAQVIRKTARVETDRETKPAVTGSPGYQAITIRVDNTGVASWKYRNARNPPLIWDRKSPAPEQFRLKFANSTSGATVKVTLPQVAVPFVAPAGTAPGDDPGLSPASLLGLDDAGARAEAQRLANLSLTLAEQATLYAPEEDNFPFPINNRENMVEAHLTDLATYIKEKADGNDDELSRLIREATKEGAQSTADSKTALLAFATSLLTNVQALLKQGALAPAAAAPQAQAPNPCLDPESPAVVRACLKQFRDDHPSRAGRRAAVTIAAALDALEQGAAAINEYASRVKEAAEPQTITAVKTTPVERAQKAFGVTLSSCEAKGGDVVCAPTLTLAPNAEGWIDGRLLAKYPAKTVIRFRVTFPFALESEQPTDQYGYFSLDPELQESPSAATWTASGSLSIAREPYYGADGAVLDADHVYDGAHTRQLRGTGRAALAYALGNRATGTIEMQLKNGTLGRKDEDFAVKVNQYNFQVFGFTGTSLKFGKYLFAAPTDGLAINESGEGATARYRWLGVSHILKRESQAGVADPHDDDHKVWLADVSNLAFPGWGSLRSLSFYALYGIDDTPDRERRYDTIGSEAYFGVPSMFLTGTVAYYHSRSRPAHGSPMRRAEGSAWLTRISRSWFENSRPARTVGLTVAGAPGDQRRTDDRYEGYVGENAAYAPDGSLFLAGIAPRLRLDPIDLFVRDRSGNPVLDKDGKPTREFVDKGLSNRRFIGVTYSEQTISPLEWIATALQIPQKDVESRQSTFRLNRYSPSEQLLGTRAGSWEAQLEFLLESPKGIKYIVKYSRVFAGGPLEALFPKEPYALIAQCNVSLK